MKSYKDGSLILEQQVEDGKGKCPFDPFQTYASIMVGKWRNFNVNNDETPRKNTVSGRDTFTQP